MKSRGEKKLRVKWEKLTSSKSHKRNLDTMKLLEGHEDFQKAVASSRPRLHIPEGGLFKKSTEFKSAWHKTYEQETYDAIDSVESAKQEIAIKEKRRIKEITRKTADKQLAILFEKIPSNYLAARADFIIKKFDLPIHFKNHIETYIIDGEITAPQHNYASGIIESPDIRGKYLSINIYTRLAPDELEELKHYIEIWGRQLAQYRPLKKIDTSVEIEKLLMAKNRLGPEPRSTADLAEEYFGSRKNTSKVREIKRSLKDLREKRFKERGER